MTRKTENTNQADADKGKMVDNSQGKALPETLQSGDTEPTVKDLPPANPLGEPVKPVEEYPNISEAGKQAAALGVETAETADMDGDYVAGETIVEHPVSPTDANPNPHGTRSEDTGGVETVTDPDTKVSARQPRDEEGTVEITGLWDRPVHLGDGRTLAKGGKARVSKDVAKTLRDNKQAK